MQIPSRRRVVHSMARRGTKLWGYGYDEVASFLGMTPGAVRQAAHAGRLQMESLEALHQAKLGRPEPPEPGLVTPPEGIRHGAAAALTDEGRGARQVKAVVGEWEGVGPGAVYWAYGINGLAKVLGMRPAAVHQAIHRGQFDPADLGSVLLYMRKRQERRHGRAGSAPVGSDEALARGGEE